MNHKLFAVLFYLSCILLGNYWLAEWIYNGEFDKGLQGIAILSYTVFTLVEATQTKDNGNE
jgi:hypothetical protein